MNGLITSKKILEIDNSVKIIFATCEKDIKEVAYAIGAVIFYYKGDLLEKLKVII